MYVFAADYYAKLRDVLGDLLLGYQHLHSRKRACLYEGGGRSLGDGVTHVGSFHLRGWECANLGCHWGYDISYFWKKWFPKL